MQQAELVTSLAVKVNMDKTEESYDHACKAVQDFLKQTKESDDLELDIKNLVDDITSCNEGSQQSWRQPELYEGSPDGSDYSTTSSVLSQVIEKMEPQMIQQLSNPVLEGKTVITPDIYLLLVMNVRIYVHYQIRNSIPLFK